ncbi:MAG: hypothetical protein HS126_37130 [Anaerolineales bacterium]|nr:hypothetical protein [Anaerolineales bacterium]
MGAIVGVHALEKVTGGIATTGMRLYGRGRPVASYRGIMIRKSPFTPKKAGAMNRLTGGRVLEANGYYFFEGGRTWHCQSTTFQFGDEPRTLTRINSFVFPNGSTSLTGRWPSRVIGSRPRARRPFRFSGSLIWLKGMRNRIPSPVLSAVSMNWKATPLRNIKHILFAANWLLVDPGERDGSDGEYVDYEALVKGTRPGGTDTGSGGVYRLPARSAVPPPAAAIGPLQPVFRSNGQHA